MSLARHSFSGSSRTLSSVRQTNNQLSISNGTFLGKLLSKGSNSNSDQGTEPIRALEEIIDLDSNLNLYRYDQIKLLNPRVLYKIGPLNYSVSLLRVSREELVNVTTNTVNLELISGQSLKQIRQSGKRLVHIGLIMLGIKGMTRKHVGAKVLIVILDKSWQKDTRKATIASMEVDMNQNEALIYCNPDLLLPINDLDNIFIGIQAKGYDDLLRKDGNLFINIGVLGKLTNSSCIQSKLNIDGITKPIISKGIKFLEPMKIKSNILEGLEWNLGKNLVQSEPVLNPESNIMFKNKNGTYSLRFSDYTEQSKNEINSEEDE